MAQRGESIGVCTGNEEGTEPHSMNPFSTTQSALPVPHLVTNTNSIYAEYQYQYQYPQSSSGSHWPPPLQYAVSLTPHDPQFYSMPNQHEGDHVGSQVHLVTSQVPVAVSPHPQPHPHPQHHPHPHPHPHPQVPDVKHSSSQVPVIRDNDFPSPDDRFCCPCERADNYQWIYLRTERLSDFTTRNVYQCARYCCPAYKFVEITFKRDHNHKTIYFPPFKSYSTESNESPPCSCSIDKFPWVCVFPTYTPKRMTFICGFRVCKAPKNVSITYSADDHSHPRFFIETPHGEVSGDEEAYKAGIFPGMFP